MANGKKKKKFVPIVNQKVDKKNLEKMFGGQPWLFGGHLLYYLLLLLITSTWKYPSGVRVTS
jgi:hypothetical protein